MEPTWVRSTTGTTSPTHIVAVTVPCGVIRLSRVICTSAAIYSWVRPCDRRPANLPLLSSPTSPLSRVKYHFDRRINTTTPPPTAGFRPPCPFSALTPAVRETAATPPMRPGLASTTPSPHWVEGQPMTMCRSRLT